jgi:DNA processing protein
MTDTTGMRGTTDTSGTTDSSSTTDTTDTSDTTGAGSSDMAETRDLQVHAAALAGLPGMTPVRLAKLLDGFSPVVAWKMVRAGAHPRDPQRKFAGPARRTEVEEVGTLYDRAGVKILMPDMVGYPSMLEGDPGAPAVLFALGDPTVLEGRRRVSIVGTRSATHYGRQVASELAGELAADGVVVVSGLARGIDGAAHAGALRATGQTAAPPVAVVGTGLDVEYPPSNKGLWDQVAIRGAVFSESALGTKPHPGVCPARNRIIAALSDVVVVVESHYGGGSLYTADAAARRSIPVCAVPGSVRSRASEGTNALLVDGCIPVRDATDVLVAISLARSGEDEHRPGAGKNRDWRSFCRIDTGQPTDPSPRGLQTHRSGREPVDSDAVMSPCQRAVFDAVDDTPTAFETILIRTDLSIAEAAEACDQLVERGALLSGAGWWSRDQG